MQPLFEHTFEGIVWSSVLSNDSHFLILDVRNETEDSVLYQKLNLIDLKLTPILTHKGSKWMMIEAFDEHLYLSEYQDESDPNNKRFYQIDGDQKDEVRQDQIPYAKNFITQPSIYEPGSDYFRTVNEFLGLELPCACEYLEIDRKIILSYYLRSGKEFERYLLMLEDGKKALKELQDTQMKGFASGSFFVVNGKLIFVKNRNEIFVYAL